MSIHQRPKGFRKIKIVSEGFFKMPVKVHPKIPASKYLKSTKGLLKKTDYNIEPRRLKKRFISNWSHCVEPVFLG